ncbi:hypothetical protein MXD60_21305, partial [Frankia sp. AgB32]
EEPGDARVSRRDLREPGGAIPPGHPTGSVIPAEDVQAPAQHECGRTAGLVEQAAHGGAGCRPGLASFLPAISYRQLC